MTEYFVVANSKAAPFFSDTSKSYIEGTSDFTNQGWCGKTGKLIKRVNGDLLLQFSDGSIAQFAIDEVMGV